MSTLHFTPNLRKALSRLMRVAHASVPNRQSRICQQVTIKNFSAIKNVRVTSSEALRKVVGNYSTDAKAKKFKDELSQWQKQVEAKRPLNEQVAKDDPEKKENIWTIPNALCFLRIGMTPVIASMVVQNQYGPAIALVAVAGVTDLLDGWIARVIPGQSTVMGSFLDPLADKLLVGTLFLSLTYVNLIPVSLTALIVGRDVLLIAFGFYVRFQSLDHPKTLSRYFNVKIPTAQLAPLFISKVNTGLQLTVIGATLASTVISSTVDLSPYLEVLWYLTAATTIGSAVSYCFAKDTVKLLRKTSGKIKFKTKEKSS